MFFVPAPKFLCGPLSAFIAVLGVLLAFPLRAGGAEPSGDGAGTEAGTGAASPPSGCAATGASC